MSAHARNIPQFWGISKTQNTYRTFVRIRTALRPFYETTSGLTKMAEFPGKDALFTKAVSYAVSKVGKAGIVLKSEQLQAVRHLSSETTFPLHVLQI